MLVDMYSTRLDINKSIDVLNQQFRKVCSRLYQDNYLYIDIHTYVDVIIIDIPEFGTLFDKIMT